MDQVGLTLDLEYLEKQHFPSQPVIDQKEKEREERRERERMREIRRERERREKKAEEEKGRLYLL